MVSGIEDQLFLAPLSAERTHRILDLGTGTGTWAMEMAHRFPAAEVSKQVQAQPGLKISRLAFLVYSKGLLPRAGSRERPQPGPTKLVRNYETPKGSL